MANENVPSAPAHLPDDIQTQWIASYAKALAQAQRDFPEDARSQRSAALKAANKLLSIPAPTTAVEIVALQDWQVLIRGTRGGNTYCVTTDGQKYSFPTKPAPAPAAGATAVKPAVTNVNR
jgi:hypothetical protein